MKHKISALLCFIGLSFFPSVCMGNNKLPMNQVIETGLNRAAQQYKKMAIVMDQIPEKLPRTIKKDGSLEVSGPTWWTSGFFPGALWYLYEYTNDTVLENAAKRFTDRVECVKDYTGDHDIGFMLYCSYGNGNRIKPSDSYRKVMLKGSESLISRYKESVGCIRSWDFGPWKYPVIIDNMMNLELLYWASKESGDKKFEQIANSHADKTMKNHFRPDYSSFHVISYDPETGNVEKKNTSQGYADESAWARGQAWALYGYTMSYRCTKDKRYLQQAENIANFIINHPHLPKDKIPYWDFDAPDIPNAPRDASAGSIMASALIELSQYVKPKIGKKYIQVAETQLRTLTSPEYLAETGTNHNFVLKHGLGHMPEKNEVDVPLTYGDYYYIEALMRYKALQ